MNNAVISNLINNAALLIVLGVLYDLLPHRSTSPKWGRKLWIGVLLGLIAIGVMSSPLRLSSGVFFDTRSILLSITGLFFGSIPTVVAAVVTSTFRFMQGGTGALTGVAVIFSSALVGLVWRRLRPHKKTYTVLELYSMGLLVHVVMLTLMLSLPWSIAMRVLESITLPVMIIYPIATVLLGKLLTRQHTQKQVEAALSDSEERFRTIFEQASVGMYLMSKEGTFLQVNPSLCEISGYANDELLQKSVRDITHPEDFDEELPLLNDLLAGKRDKYTIEKRYIKPDGTPNWVASSVSPMVDGYENPDQYPDQYIGVVKDINQRKTTEEKLQQRNRFIEAILDNLPIGLAVNFIDKGTATYMNNQFTNIYGWPREALTDIANFFKCVYPDPVYREAIVNRVVTDIESGDPEQMQWDDIEIVRQDGQKRIIAAKNIPLYDQNFMISIVRDVTAQKRAEETLMANEEKYRNLVETSHDLIWSIDREGRITYINQASRHIYGYEPEAMIGRFYTDFIPSEQVSENEKAWQQAIENNDRIVNFENRVQHKDGHEFLLNANAVLLRDNKGNIIGSMGTSHDITQQKEHEEKLRAMLHDKTVLLRELYHRTKNTLQVISSFLGLQSSLTPDNFELQKLVVDTQNRIQAISLVHQMLYQSQDLSHINLCDYIQNLARVVMGSYDVSSQRVTLNLDIEDISVLLDTAIPCGLVLNELLSNSLKHAFPDNRSGEITIKLKRHEEGNLELIFADNGVGLPADFDMAQQNTLGMETIEAITIHQMGGTISRDNTNGLAYRIEFSDSLYTERV